MQFLPYCVSQLKAAREKLGRSCDMCSNYESQLQSMQENEKKAWSQVCYYSQYSRVFHCIVCKQIIVK